ncbi:uncharacterized protein [Linepithema humile]|uniref:uncharacterized protein isoform X1 n=1 Tax=Linepithema humile TaxID=83485 RepID=UPI00062392E5|nr:PREDICTED: uncharacterized protein LOC105677246 [Linepithema humile]XP_012231144.1 PREDICTED: uncharacterized protein LOC105677246 [Linepithema humile]XP_012231145.1 PREDICTED: uncharacterized protein LOC105677246 [Linepithema humile]
MDSGDDDMFANSDEEMSLSTETANGNGMSNPVEEHLLKQLNDIQNRIDTTSDEISELKVTTAHVLNALQQRALYGENISSDSGSDLYTVEGEPAVKEQRCNSISNADKNLEIVSQWQYILQDKWIIGVELQNRSCCTLLNPRYYPYIRDEMEICGESMFWKLKAESYFHWEKINLIYPGSVHVVATMVLDLPTFDRESVVEYWSTISYEIDEIQYQIPVPPIQLTIAETIDSSCIKFLEENEHSAVLALKSTCNAESIVRLLKNNQDEYESWKKQFFHFLGTKAFERVCSDIFLVKEHLSLMYCLIEIQSITVNEMSVKIFARSVSQLNVILHLLRDEFSKDGHNVIVVEEIDDYVDAATALIRELELIRDKKSTLEIQEAKAITDLLIS